ncbi:hypothetical protein AABM38_17560 [Heyndrickxia sp. MSNUG]|uniref:hypothetical protein n=1 Tax=Heyndrickxia sp. MSNUG TaxID=3136677 RepID=UPI003C2EA5DF
MKSLLLLLISAVLALVWIKYISLGLNRKEKIIVILSSFLIGSFGLVFCLIAPPWQALIIMVLLAFSVGYIMVSRSVGIVTVKGSEQLNVNDNLDRNTIESDNSSEIATQQGSLIRSHEDEIVPKVLPNLQVIDLEEDISFLEERNKLPLTDFDDIPVINFESQKDFNDEKWINEVEEHEMYATSQS